MAPALRKVEANARLTAMTAAVLFVLLAVEGVTIVFGVFQQLTLHVFVGMLLVPPIALKMASTGWRFAQYYRGSPAYAAKGPPPIVLRLLGPLVVALTVVLFASGIGLVLAPSSFGGRLFRVHQVSFVLWLAVMTVHVLGHLRDTAETAPRDFIARTRRRMTGVGTRVAAVLAAIVVGVVLGVVMLGPTRSYRSQVRFGHSPSPGQAARAPER
jgi:hypothetical protein